MLYGTIFGDIAGSTYEFKPCEDDNFITVPNGSSFTDDTVMTLAVAQWLMEDPEDINVLIKYMQRLGNLYIRAGYGRMFRKWLKSFKPQPYNSFGNGSTMRVSPCAWVAKSLEEAEELAFKSASVTHNHPEGIKGAQSVASAVYLAKIGKSKEEIKEYIKNKYNYNLDRTVQDIKNSGYSFNETCQGSVPEAIICFLESTNYEDCIRKVISIKGDSDTQAAIAGSIAEAFYGFPNNLKNNVENYLDSNLLNILNEFNKYEKFSNN